VISEGTKTKIHKVAGDGGTQLYVIEAGNPHGTPILFIHGYSQNHLCFFKQINSELLSRFRLVALDLRGHGHSDTPSEDSYSSPISWAFDLKAVMDSLQMDNIVAVAWSYGGLVLCDYIATYGEDRLAAINLVGANTEIGDSLMPYLSAPFLAVMPALLSNDVNRSTSGAKELISLLTASELPEEVFYMILGYNLAVSPKVRAAMVMRSVNHDETLARLSTPVLVSHGEEDNVILKSLADHHLSLLQNGRSSIYPKTGHSPFIEAEQRFNTELAEFASQFSPSK